MLRKLLTALLLLLTQDIIAQPLDTLRRRDPGGWEFVQVLRGKTVIAEGSLRNGIREGVWTEFWENKLPHTVTAYRDGKKNGLHVDIRRTGQVEWQQSYTADKLDGPSRKYLPGATIIEEHYYSDGIRSGSSTTWYANGRIKEQSNYNADVRDGKATYYSESGAKLAEYNYNRGKLDGDAAQYSESGRIVEYGTYTDDVQSGVWKEYHPNGKLKAEGKYNDGEKTGIWKQYDDTGKELKPITYKTGKAKK